MNFITQRTINPEAFFLLKPAAEAGALATFFGVVRNHHEGKAVQKLYYECYTSMANKEIYSIREKALRRFELLDVRILHRVGLLEVGEIAIAVLVSSAHRAEAFEACSNIVNEIKHTVPIWKKEYYVDGTNAWVLCGHPSQEVPV